MHAHFASLLKGDQLSPGVPPFLSAIYMHSVEESHVSSDLFVSQNVPSNIFKACAVWCLCVVSLSVADATTYATVVPLPLGIAYVKQRECLD
jgi:hypothetical protein